MKNYRQTGGRRLGRGQGGYLGQRAADSVSEESAREHLLDTEVAAPPTSRPSQLPSILLQSLKSALSPLLPLSSAPASSWAAPLSPLTHPPHSRLKGLLKLNLTLHLPEALETQSYGGPGGFPQDYRLCKCISWPLQFFFLSLGWSSLRLPHPCSSFCGLRSGVLSSGKPSLMSLTRG